MRKTAAEIADKVLLKLIEEARNDPGIHTPIRSKMEPIPLKSGDKTVGFHLPAKNLKTGKLITGTIYVSKEYRGKGLASAALKDFLDKNPESISFINKDNIASQKAHSKAGWEDSKVHAEGNPQTQVWRKTAHKENSTMTTYFEAGYRDVLEKVGMEEGPSPVKWGLGMGAAGMGTGATAGAGMAVKRLMRSPAVISNAMHGTPYSPRFTAAATKMMKGRMGKGALIGGGLAAALGIGSALMRRKDTEE